MCHFWHEKESEIGLYTTIHFLYIPFSIVQVETAPTVKTLRATREKIHMRKSRAHSRSRGLMATTTLEKAMSTMDPLRGPTLLEKPLEIQEKAKSETTLSHGPITTQRNRNRERATRRAIVHH